MDGIVFCINVNAYLRMLYYRLEPARVETDKPGCADLLRVIIYRLVLFDRGRGARKDGDYHETPVFDGYGAAGRIKYDRFCPLASRGRETDWFRDEFRAGNVGADNSNRRGGTLF